MEKVVSLALAGLMVVGLAGCRSGNDGNANQSFPPNTNIQENGLLSDQEFLSFVKDTFSEIDVDIDEDNIKIESDSEVSGVRDVSVSLLHDGVEMLLSGLCVDGVWSPVSISDANTHQYYWLDSSVESYGDVYDWETGKKVSEKTEKLPDTLPSYSLPPAKVEQEMIYGNNNYCRFILEYTDNEASAIGVCQFDGNEPDKETLRALAFTTYCVQNADIFSDGNLTMLYYSGDEDGFARYEKGELGLSDFPDVWGAYASDVTQEQIENELGNIIDSIG